MLTSAISSAVLQGGLRFILRFQTNSPVFLLIRIDWKMLSVIELRAPSVVVIYLKDLRTSEGKFLASDLSVGYMWHLQAP